MPKPQKHVFVCTQSRPPGHPRGSCGQKNAVNLYQTFVREFDSKQLYDKFALTNTACLGACQNGAAVLVYPDNILYTEVTPEDTSLIVEQHLLQQQPVERLLAPKDLWD